MQFQKPPSISKRAIDRAGDALINNASTPQQLQEARDTLNQWRACHAYPINTFQSTLRRKIAGGSFGHEAYIAQRLKRSPTIIRKLQEGKPYDIKLLNMQDIAGVRAILPSMKDVRGLEKVYRDNKRFEHILHRSKDYIQEPKPKDGYRSIHLIYKYRNKKHPEWNDLWTELQIRTKLQHNWATAVETLHTFLDKAIKTRQGQKGDEQWTEFFCLISSAFARIEGTPLIPKHATMASKDILEAIRKYEKELKVTDKLKAFPRAMQLMMKKKKSHYHLIVLDSKQKIVRVTSFNRDEFERANSEYERVENESINKEEIESVLVSATDVEEAYPSFFANTKDFTENLTYILSGEWAKG